MPTPADTPPGSKISRADLLFLISIRIALFARRIRARFAERARTTSQTEARWSALYHLTTETDGLIQSDLAERMGVQGPTLVRLLDALEARGLVSRVEAPGDRRAKIVRLEPSGRAMIDEVDSIAAQLREEIFAGIGDTELRTTLSVLERLVSAAAGPEPEPARRRRAARAR